MVTPGPRTIPTAMMLILKGLLMGLADIIPGVSGGTVALITGIYQDLIEALNSFNLKFFQKLIRGRIIEALGCIHFRFLVFLFTGIGLAIVAMARILHDLLQNYPEPTLSFLFGLISASILILSQKVTWNKFNFLLLISGFTSAFWIVGLIPVSTPNTIWFVFLCGVLGICAMILPGISGAFILLILGKYEFITGALKSPFSANELSGDYNLLIIFVFCLGCTLGLISFSRVLKRLFTRWPHSTMALLTGLMAGSMRKVWPWKEIAVAGPLEKGSIISNQTNILPKLDTHYLWLCAFLMVVSRLGSYLIHRIIENREKVKNEAGT